MSSDAAELLEILTRFETDRVCYAYDRIVAESNKNVTATIGCNITATTATPHDIHG